jgi:hypothetical protein
VVAQKIKKLLQVEWPGAFFSFFRESARPESALCYLVLMEARIGRPRNARRSREPKRLRKGLRRWAQEVVLGTPIGKRCCPKRAKVCPWANGGGLRTLVEMN